MRKLSAGCAEKYIARLVGVGQNRVNIPEPDGIAVIKAGERAVFQCEDGAVHRHAVDDLIRAGLQHPDVFFIDLRCVDHMQDHILPDSRNAVCGRNIDRAAAVLRHLAHGEGGKTGIAVELEHFAVGDDCGAAVIRADPEPVPAVKEQTDDAGKTGRGIHAFKVAAVIADESAVAADPDRAVRIRDDGVCFRGRQTVRVVIQHGGIVAADRGFLFGCRVQDGQAGSGQRQAENGDEQHTDRRPVPVKRSVHMDHLLSHGKENIHSL